MAHATDRRGSGVPWWTPLVLLALLVAGVGAAIATRDGGSHGAGQVLGTRAVVTQASQSRPARVEHMTIVGRRATAHGVRVLGVVGDRIFWVGTPAAQLLVHLQGPGTRYAIRTGQRLAFTGTLARNAGGSAAAWGLDSSEGLARFVRTGVHVEVYGPSIGFL